MKQVKKLTVLVSWLLSLAAANAIASEKPLPIFDAHVHYSRDAWNAFDPDAVGRLLDAAGVPRALVSSSPDDGTLKLHAKDASRFVPVLRPYRGTVGSGNWFTDPSTPDYLAARLERGVYAGIGEFHLFDVAAATTPIVAEVTKLALKHDIVLHVHSGAAPVRALFRQAPEIKVLWAHAGMSTPAEEVGKLMDARTRLWAEVSFRAGDIAPGGNLSAAWREVFLRHSDRFLIGSDTYVNGRWHGYEGLIAEHRRWLDQLPRATAEAIAYKNAVRLFGAGGKAVLSN